MHFPITDLLPEILASLAVHPRLVLEAPPGAGKTTQVPLALLDAAWLGTQKILMLEPRRVAARAAADRSRHRRHPHPHPAGRSAAGRHRRAAVRRVPRTPPRRRSRPGAGAG